MVGWEVWCVVVIAIIMPLPLQQAEPVSDPPGWLVSCLLAGVEFLTDSVIKGGAPCLARHEGGVLGPVHVTHATAGPAIIIYMRCLARLAFVCYNDRLIKADALPPPSLGCVQGCCDSPAPWSSPLPPAYGCWLLPAVGWIASSKLIRRCGGWVQVKLTFMSRRCFL